MMLYLKHCGEHVGFNMTFLCAASVNPEVLERIFRSLIPTGADLAIASFALTYTASHIFKGNLFIIRSPSK
jgi:hypothetical protein